MTETDPEIGTDSRPARREALQAAAIWLAALIVTVGLSAWLNAEPSRPVLGVPRWTAFGVFAPWLAFFFVHTWICLRRLETPRKP